MAYVVNRGFIMTDLRTKFGIKYYQHNIFIKLKEDFR